MHSPLPWKYDKQEGYILDNNDKHVLSGEDFVGYATVEDGEFIVWACNNYEKLLLACELAERLLDQDPDYHRGRVHFNLMQALDESKGAIDA